MSEQGPGGYGGGGYGGGPPPGGQGGWGPGQPPGGYGQPPGGYGQPPGAPQGWPQQPGGVAPTQPGGPPAPGKKANPLVWVGIGCGALFLIGAASAAWFGYSSYQTYERAKSAMAAASGLGATISVSDAGIVVKLPGLGEVSAPALPSGAAAPGGPSTAPTVVMPAPSGGLGTGGPNCDAAVACCKAMIAKVGQAQTAASCDALKASPDFACAEALATYKKMAPLVGVTCP